MSTLVIGLSVSVILFLLASGLTLIFGMLRVINFAHGAFYMLGAYLAYQIAYYYGFWVTLLFVPLILALVAFLVERLTLRPIYTAPHEYQLVITFGLVLIIGDLVRMIWGLEGKSIEVPMFLSGSIMLFDSDISRYRLFVTVMGLLSMAALLFSIEKTRVGLLIRSCSINPDMAETLGVNVQKIRTMVFAMGVALAGFAGVMTGPIMPIDLQMGKAVILDSFIVIIIGGLGNIRGAIVAALLIGLLRTYGQQYFSEWIELIVYSILIITLLVRPQGLFSKKERMA